MITGQNLINHFLLNKFRLNKFQYDNHIKLHTNNFKSYQPKKLDVVDKLDKLNKLRIIHINEQYYGYKIFRYNIGTDHNKIIYEKIFNSDNFKINMINDKIKSYLKKNELYVTDCAWISEYESIVTFSVFVLKKNYNINRIICKFNTYINTI
jgi:hypothetical protein